MNKIKELLSKDHFQFSEYIGQMLIDGYDSVKKGPLLTMEMNQPPKVFIDLFLRSIEEFETTTNIFEEFVDSYMTKINFSFWEHYKNLMSINQLYNSSINMMMDYLKAHEREITEYELFYIMEKTKSSLQYTEKFDESISRLRKYIEIGSGVSKLVDSEIDTSNILDVCKKYSSMMEHICSVIDERNIRHFNQKDIKDFNDLVISYINGSKELIDILESDDIDADINDAASALSSLKSGNNKLKMLAFQIKHFIN